MPMVRKMMTELSGKTPVSELNPDEAVALGAAIQAYICENEQESSSESTSGVPMVIGGEIVDINISDVTSQALGVVMLDENDQEKNFVVIPKNAKVPNKGEQHARTVVEMQSSILVQVTQGDDEDVKYVTVIGSKEIPIPRYPKGAPFTVLYAYDIDQTVYVELFDDTAQKTVGKFEIDRLLNMDEDQVKNAMRKIGRMDIQ